MLDHYSAYPAPTRQAAIAYVKHALHTEIMESGLRDDEVTQVIVREIDTFGSFGSQAAWLMYTAQQLVSNTQRSLFYTTHYVLVEQPNATIDLGHTSHLG